MESDIEIKSCPICGRKPDIIIKHSKRKGKTHIKVKCGAWRFFGSHFCTNLLTPTKFGLENNLRDAIDYWNDQAQLCNPRKQEIDNGN